MSCVRCLISGRVQGVFFRAATRNKAVELGLRGRARNLPDGRVEVIACGPEDAPFTTAGMAVGRADACARQRRGLRND